MWKKLSELLRAHGGWQRSVAWLWQQTKPCRAGLVFLMLLRIAAALLGVGSAAVNKLVLDHASGGLSLAWSLVLMVVLQLVSIGLSAITSVQLSQRNEELANRVRHQVYQSVLGAQWQPLQAYHSEELLSRLTSDVGVVSNGVVSLFSSLLALVTQVVAAFFLLYHYEPTLAVFAIVIGPLAAAASLFFGWKLKQLQAEMQQFEANYRIFLQEHLAHLALIKAFCAESFCTGRLDALQEEHRQSVKKRNTLSVMANGVIGLTFSGAYLYAFISGVLKLAAGVITYGTFSAFLTLVGQIQGPLLNLAGTLPSIASVLASAGRITEIATVPEEPLPVSSHSEAFDFSHKIGIHVQSLSFAYAQEPVLQGVSFTIAPGETVVLMGESGAGKTTLMRILLGLLTPQSGTAVYLDQKGAALPCGAGRRCLSYVPQGNTLFSGTIRENLLLGLPEREEPALWQALEGAAAADFVRRLPDGLDTVIGERATGLSEGQAQRIAIARAFLHPAQVLLLDEATSALDAKSEEHVLSYLRRLPAHPTCLVITHRESATKYCDRILMVDGVRVTERKLS